MSESAPDPLVGRTIDGYRIDEIIGRGGMGVVYKATQLSLGRPVALKLLPEEVTENRQFLDRFEREVDILARLAHPNIVTVFERGEVDGRPYIAMEYVRGTSLREVVRSTPRPPAEALLIVRSILSALEHAHGEGIVHRDIKPENVLVAPGGIVKVADFGLSRLMEGDLETRLTKTHVALGTFEYMSPEQREMAKDADERSDLYATGVVLYEMIAGELPIGSFDSLSTKRPTECDRRLDDIVDKSLKKSPDSRWQNAREMGEAVSHLLSSAALPVEPPPVPVARQPRPSDIPEQSMVVSQVDRPLPEPPRHPRHPRDRGPGLHGLVWGLFGLGVAAAFFYFVTAQGSAPVILFGLGVAAAALIITFGLRAAHARRERGDQRERSGQPNYALSFGVTALWVVIVMVLSKGPWRDEEVMWLCIGAVASVFLLPRLPGLFANAARALLVIVFVLLGLAFAGALLFSARHVPEENLAPQFETVVDAPVRAAPHMLHIATLTGEISELELLEFLEDADVQRWVESLVPGAEMDLTNQTYSTSSDRLTLHLGMSNFRKLGRTDQLRAAAALGAAAEVVFPNRVGQRTRADAGFEKLLATSSFKRSR
jgi:tRNA A-37 threonylcarbamoyl transferase component Bud32